MRNKSYLLMAIIVSICLFSISALSQATTGTLRGEATDSTGGVIAGATVKIKSESTGVETTTDTNGEGSFAAQTLNPGAYTVTVEAKGFKRAVKTGVQITAGTVTPVGVKLEAGNVSETVTVTSNAETVLQTEQSQISTTIDTRRVQDLPSNGAGGGIDTLALLIPGVIENRQGGTNTNGAGLSVNGNRGRSNNFQIDGSDNNDLSVGGPALFVDFQDAVQEFQVITNNFDARFGRNQGAIVNIVGKSGGNDFHGSAFLHHQDAFNLNSLDNFEKRSGTPISRNLYNVFGGTIGGPIYGPRFGEGVPALWSGKNRAFFFFAYQGIRNPNTSLLSSLSLGILPTEFGRLQTQFPGNAVINTIVNNSAFAIPGATINTSTSSGTAVPTQFNLTAPTGCARAIAVGVTPVTGCGTYTTFINPATGQPFLTGGAYDTLNFGTAAAPNLFQAAQFQRSFFSGYTENYYNTRIDVRPTSKDNISGHYINQKQLSKNGLRSSNGYAGDIPATSKNLGGNWSRTISNSIVNDFRLSFNRIGVEFGGGCDLARAGCIPGPAQIGSAFANISFTGSPGITKTNNLPVIGPATNLPQGRIGKVYQIADNLTWVRGKHSITFGAEFKKLDTLAPFLPNYNGTYGFNSVTRLINNAPSSVSLVAGDPTLSFIEKDQYYFVQDDFKIRTNLTLNLGVRYEFTGQPINILAEQSTIRENDPARRLYDPTLPISVRTVPRVPSDKNNFAPRLGFAYTPHFWKALFGEDATVFRGGFSIAYDAAFYNILLNVDNAAPFAAALTIPTVSLPSVGSPAPLPNNPNGNVVRAAAFASGLLPLGQLNPIYLAQSRVAQDFHAPYSEQFSLGVQHRFGRKQIAEVRYVGTHGISLFQNVNSNFVNRNLVNGFNLTRSPGGTNSVVPTCVGVVNPCVSFPSFANLLPAGTQTQTCVDNPATPFVNEAACDGREFRQGSITDRKNTSQSIYHSLQAQYNGRFFRDSVSLGASYTFSKTIDDSSEIFAFNDTITASAQNPYCINRCERGLSNLNRPHAFSTNFVFDVPFYKEQRGLVGHLLGGWQINGTYIITSGATYTPADGVNLGLGLTYLSGIERPFIGNPNADVHTAGISQVDALFAFGIPITNANGFYSLNALNTTGALVSVTPNDVRFILNGPGAAKLFGTPFGNSPRGYLRGPIFNSANISLFKNINVVERLKVQLRAEAFNAFNHPNPGLGVERGGSLPGISIVNAGVPGAAFANNQDIELARRVIQLGIRLVF